MHLHRIRRWLRRAKGMLWVAEPMPIPVHASSRGYGGSESVCNAPSSEEDAQAQWEWELSGQLRFSCRRTPGGFGGAEAFSSLVLGWNLDDDV